MGHKLQVKGLNPSSLQGDSVIIEHLQSLSRKNTRISLKDCPDLGPILFVFASLKHGGIFTDCNRLMDKESDRISAMQEEMAKLGLQLERGYDYVKVLPGRPKKTDIILSAHNDHRIAMALAILLTESGGLIHGIDSVKKSYPNFFTDLKNLGVNIDIYD